METKKSSKKSSKTQSPVEAKTGTESTPETSSQATRSAAQKRPAAARKTSTPKKSAHRHSKLAITPTSAATVVHSDDIARLAYQYWEERHDAHGSAEEDWHRAEKALSART